MMTTHSCIIVDDNEIDRLTTVSFVRRFPFLHIAGVYENAADALSAIHKSKPSVLFLDIDMPGMSGLELRRELLDIPACVFITAFSDYALESFEVAAFDFLIKPLKTERFNNTIDRLKEYLDIRQKSQLFDYKLGTDTIFIKDGHEQVKLRLHDIIYLEALKDYTSIVTQQKKYCVLSSIGNLLKEKDFQSFIRVHRSYAVQKHYIDKITTQQVVAGNVSLPVGRLYKDDVAALIQRP
jgi:two-component system, LytTR family, response regulator